MEVNEEFIELALEMAKDKEDNFDLKEYLKVNECAVNYFPRTRADIFFSSSHGSLAINYFRIQNLFRFYICSFVTGKVAINGYRRDGLSVFDLVPSINLELSEKSHLEFVYGKNTQGVGYFRKFGESFSSGAFIGLARNEIYLDIEARYQFSDTSKFILNSNNFGSHTVISFKKRLNSLSLQLYLKQIPLNLIFGLRSKLQLLEDLSLVLTSEITDKEQKLHKLGLGVHIKLGEHLKLTNTIEEHRNSIYWILGLKRGGLSLNFPIKLHKLPRLVSLFGVISFAYIARGLFRTFFGRNDEKKKLSQKEFSVEFVKMVEGKVRENMRIEEEKNGLVVVKAVYGNKNKIEEALNRDGLENAQLDEDVIDVTVPINFMVDNSKLSIPQQPKESLQGFYYVCEAPVLYLEIWLKGEVSRVFVENNQSFFIS